MTNQSQSNDILNALFQQLMTLHAALVEQ